MAAATTGAMPTAVAAAVASLPAGDQVAARITWASMSVAQRLDPEQQSLRELPDVDRGGREEVRPARRGDQEQLVHVATHPIELVEAERHRLGPGRRVVVEQFEMTAHDRDRSAQLVRDVEDGRRAGRK